MNNFLEKLTNNIDIFLGDRFYIDFLLSCNKGKVIYRDASFSDKDYILGTKRPWATKHWYNSETCEHRRALERLG